MFVFTFELIIENSRNKQHEAPSKIREHYLENYFRVVFDGLNCKTFTLKTPTHQLFLLPFQRVI